MARIREKSSLQVASHPVGLTTRTRVTSAISVMKSGISISIPYIDAPD